jgi:hypothetical protein
MNDSRPERRKPMRDREGVTHKVSLNQPGTGLVDFFITLNRFADGRPCEIFTKATHGYQGWCDAISRLVSVLLQHGVPVDTICAQLAYASFAPCGMVPGFGMAHSFPDYLARWLVRENAERLKRGKGSGGPATQGGRGPNAG